MDIAVAVSRRGSCDRLQVGAVVVDARHRILSTGYNGAPPEARTCEEAGHYLVDNHCKRTVHAERNAIAHAARHGVALQRSRMYVTHAPCLDCLVLMAAAGFHSCVYLHEYRTINAAVATELAPTVRLIRLRQE